MLEICPLAFYFQIQYYILTWEIVRAITKTLAINGDAVKALSGDIEIYQNVAEIKFWPVATFSAKFWLSALCLTQIWACCDIFSKNFGLRRYV